ncbi:tuberoinfundibular peptide of 39 residues [Sphaeramia orbicularis]|uniref:Tuberoinfundibular peptide of 39 residues n=1 Tax=Sphaeramia orbicularis TaxID=375764 RepID=A0A673CPJ2_9TELE|nr:tuberoinfundibular peptide of 39 residues [Sphaeramia orbicularis]
MPVVPCMSLLLLCILGMTLVTTGFPQTRLPLSDDSEEPKRDDWDTLFPSISLRDWSVQMSSPGFRANTKTGMMRGAWLFAPERAEASVERLWSPPDVGMIKRNVVADDAAFREKSRLLTSMERQKWLNSYMQKLLVVNSSR